jgi:hypothetical protein
LRKDSEHCPFSLKDLLKNNGYYECLEKEKRDNKRKKKIIKQGGKVDTSNYFHQTPIVKYFLIK